MTNFNILDDFSDIDNIHSTYWYLYVVLLCTIPIVITHPLYVIFGTATIFIQFIIYNGRTNN